MSPLTVTRRSFLQRGAGTLALCLAARKGRAAAEPPTAYRVGCYTRPWDQHDYRVALDGIAEAGFRFAGLMTQKRELGGLVISTKTTPEEATAVGEEARKRGLRILSVYGGEFAVGESLEAGIQGLQRLIASCAAARSETLMVGGTGSAEHYDDYYKAVAECCPEAAEKGVGIVLKPHGGLNATGPQCRKAIQRVGHAAFRLWYDPGNIFYYSDGKLNPVDDLGHVDGIVTGMCIKDFRMEERNGAPSKEVMLTPGTGRVDFPAVLRGLRKGGFREGPLLIECLDRGSPKEITSEAKKAKAFVEEVVARATVQ